MTNYELMLAAADLNSNRQTLMVEIRDIHSLLGNALQRFGRIAELSAKDQALAAMWGESLGGRDGESPIAAEDVETLVKAAAGLKAVIESVNAKRPIFFGAANQANASEV